MEFPDQNVKDDFETTNVEISPKFNDEEEVKNDNNNENDEKIIKMKD